MLDHSNVWVVPATTALLVVAGAGCNSEAGAPDLQEVADGVSQISGPVPVSR